MRTIALFATAAAAALVASSASAAILISFDGTTTAFSQSASGVFSFTAACGVAGAACGGFETVTVEGSAPLALPGLLHSDNVSVNAPASGTASLTIWVTRTDLSGLGDSFFSSFTTNNQGGPVSSHLETLISASNQTFGGTTLASFNNNTVGSASSNATTPFATGGGLYSVTEKYVLTATGSGVELSASPTITLATSRAVPEPAAWALMIMGFGAAGAMLRRRREHFAAV